MNCPNLCGQYKKGLYGSENLSNILTSLFKGSQFCCITKIPPMVVVLILPLEVLFCHCPFLLDLFIVS